MLFLLFVTATTFIATQALPGALANLTQALGGIQIPGMNASTTNGEEDCLQLNIFRPSGLSNNNTSIPVMFFMFGGAFLIGSTASYNGSSLVNRSIENNQPIMLVTVNYRVNVSIEFLNKIRILYVDTLIPIYSHLDFYQE